MTRNDDFNELQSNSKRAYIEINLANLPVNLCFRKKKKKKKNFLPL
jgi:hypothetical protein